jgi:hypothetical protein
VPTGPLIKPFISFENKVDLFKVFEGLRDSALTQLTWSELFFCKLVKTKQKVGSAQFWTILNVSRYFCPMFLLLKPSEMAFNSFTSRSVFYLVHAESMQSETLS